MITKIKKIILVICLFLSLSCPSWANDHGWDWYGSGRDRPYSEYVDNYYAVGSPSYPGSHVEDLYPSDMVLSAVPPPPGLPPPIMPQTPIPGEYAVNIPNRTGGFNTVIIKKSGEGFVGPKGEYYPEFPKVWQLQMKYSD